MKTNASYILMSPATKKRFSKELAKAYKAAMGKEKYVRDALELRVCWGFKR